MKKWILLGAGLLIIFGSVVWKLNSAPQEKFIEYVVKMGSIETKILATGTVQPENRLQIKAPVAGRIDEVLVDEGAFLKKGQILAWMSSTERAALLDAARAQGPQEYKKWAEMYRPTPIIAPLPGTVILRGVEPGQTITSTDTIFAMSDRLTVKAQVDETDIAKIKLKQGAQITLDAYPDQPVSAVVDQIAFEAKTVNNVTTYVVDVLPEVAPKFMRSGMTANVSFYQEKKDNVLTVPNEAIRYSDGKTFVLLKKDNSNFEKEIQLGISNGKKSEVIEGLVENDVVVRAEQGASDKKGSSSPFSPFGGRRQQGSSSGHR